MSLNLTIGANEVGILITTFINGITTAQLYTYHSWKFKDPVWVKFFAYAVWFIECAHTLILWLYLYRVTVTFYGVPASIAASTWNLGASAVFNGIIEGMVQSYFAWKIWLISGKPYITFISWTGCATLLSFNAALCHVATRQNQTLPVVTHDYRWLIVCIGVNILAVDILNTVSLSYLLWKKRNGIRSTDKMLEKLLVWTIETGLMTTISATIMLIAMVALANTAVWVAVSVFHAKLYSNSLFISLNRRELFRRDQRSLVTQALTGSGGSKQKTSLNFPSSMNPVESHHAPGISLYAMQVQISTETAVDNEYPNEGPLKEEKLGDQDHPYGRMV